MRRELNDWESRSATRLTGQNVRGFVSLKLKMVVQFMMDRAISLACLMETWQLTPNGCEAQELDGFPVVHHGEKENICRRGRNDMAIIHSLKARVAWEARGKMFVNLIASKSIARRIRVVQLHHRVGNTRA